MAGTQQDKPGGFRPIEVDIRPDAQFKPIVVGAFPSTLPEAAFASEPPRGGAGSDREAWATYAARLGVKHDPDATRDDIVAAVDTHHSSKGA